MKTFEEVYNLFEVIREVYDGQMRNFLVNTYSGEIHISIDVSDQFYWGTADSEEIDDVSLFKQAIQELKELTKEDKHAYLDYCDLYYVAKKRNKRPQGAVLNAMRPLVKKVFLKFPYRETDLFNPCEVINAD